MKKLGIASLELSLSIGESSSSHTVVNENGPALSECSQCLG
ncbi:MAG: hypothetical protein ACTS84_00805 [Arsenophonus sp. NC-LC2-MAG3]